MIEFSTASLRFVTFSPSHCRGACSLSVFYDMLFLFCPVITLSLRLSVDNIDYDIDCNRDNISTIHFVSFRVGMLTDRRCIMISPSLIMSHHIHPLHAITYFRCYQINLSFPVLHALSDRCQALHTLVLSDLAMPRRIARATVTSVKGLEFNVLQTLSITRCPMIAEVRL